MEPKKKKNGMEKLATFIVDKRHLFFVLYIFALIFSVIAIPWTKVENDITTYLSDDTETKQGLVVMSDNLITNGTARIMLSNVTYETAAAVQEEIAAVPGVSMVDFNDTESRYKDGSALYEITFAGEATDPVSVAGMEQIREIVAPYDASIDTLIGFDEIALLTSEMGSILVVGVVIMLIVLVLTSRAYAEILVFLCTFGAAAVLNMGTNFIFGQISFISNAVTVVLQLALAVDYAIILCHRFSDEHETLAPREACIAALSKALPEISASSLTTISGLAAMGFMEFRIGLDMAMCLVKAISFSLLTVFTLMPGLLMLFSGLIDKTRHKKLLPKVSFIGKFAVATRWLVLPLFLVALVAGFHYSSQCPFCYDYTDLTTAKQSETQIAYQKIKSTFGTSNMVALVVPTGNYEAEQEILAQLEARPEVNSAMGLSNIEALDGYVLTDSLTPRRLSELIGLDYEVTQALYTAYAVSENQYGELLGGIENYEIPLYDLFMFLLDEMDNMNISLEDQMGDAAAMLDQLETAQASLRSEKYSRMVVYLNLPMESEETFAFLDTIHEIADPYYDGEGVYVLGNSTSCRDLSASFSTDNVVISLLSAFFVILILLFTFKSAALSVLLIGVIQTSIWLNFSINTFTGVPLYFIGYLTVTAIQMGANIDYAIVLSSHFLEHKQHMPAKEAIVEAINGAFPTIFTSGSILTVAAGLVGNMTSQPVVAIMGTVLARGTFISIIMVLFVLPQLLVLSSNLIDRTSFTMKSLELPTREATGTMAISGHIRGHVDGFIEADVKGILHGKLDASVSTGTSIQVAENTAEEGGEAHA